MKNLLVYVNASQKIFQHLSFKESHARLDAGLPNVAILVLKIKIPQNILKNPQKWPNFFFLIIGMVNFT